MLPVQLAFTKTHLIVIVIILTSTKSNEAQSAQTSAWCSVPAKLDSSTRLPTSLSRKPKFSTNQNDILPLWIFKTDWLTHCRTKHDYLSMVKFKSMHFSRSDEVCILWLDFQFVLQPPTLSFVVSKTMFPGHVDKTHARPKGGTSLGKSPLWFWWHRYPPFARWRHEPPGMNLSQPVLWMTSSELQKSVRMESKTQFHRKTLQSRPRLVYLWSSQTFFEGHPQKRSPEYASRIYLSLCPGCQRQLCDCSKTLLGQRLKPHVS